MNIRKTILVIFTLCIAIAIQAAQVSKSITITAGSLTTSLTATEKSNTVYLIIRGSLDARDFLVLRDAMPNLTSIDISGATISAYTGNGGTEGIGNFVYSENAIPQFAFYNQLTTKSKTALTSIVLPDLITIIGNYSFYGCTGLTDILIPASVTTIGINGFNGCTGLTSIELPASVAVIGSAVFCTCRNLTSFKCNNPIPANLDTSLSVFVGIKMLSCTLYVPAGTKAAYQAASQWCNFTIIEEALPTSVEENSISTLRAILVNNQVVVSGLKLNGNNSTETITIYNLEGALVYSRKVTGETMNLDLSCAGIYLIQTGNHSVKIAYTN